MNLIIGVTPDTHSGRKIKTRSEREKIVYLWDQYLAPFLDCGVLPVILPVLGDRRAVRRALERLDGVVLAGGNFDVPPEYYGQEPLPWLGPLKRERSRSELLILEEALRRDMPVLGICGGMQLINVAFGGTLYQDLSHERPKSRNHQQKVVRERTIHQVTIDSGTMLHRICSSRRIKRPLKLRVNSTHHQAVRDVGHGLRSNAIAGDGLVEGVESPEHGFVLGVQWHPELLYRKHQEQERIFKAFSKAAKS